MKGTVKTFSKQKGYGFIQLEGREDVFFHFSSLIMEGFKTVDPNTEVEFDLQETEKGQRAINIKVVK